MIPASEYRTPLEPTVQNALKGLMRALGIAGDQPLKNNVTAIRCLLAIATMEQVSQAKIADALNLSAGTARRTVMALMAAGLILEWPEQSDGRTRILHLTDKGLQCCLAVSKALLEAPHG